MRPCRETASRTPPFVQSLRQLQPSEKQTAHRQQSPVQAAACTAAPHKRRMRPYYVPIKPRDMIRRQRNQAYAADQSRPAETLKAARSFPDSRYIRKQIPDTPARKNDGFPADNRQRPSPCRAQAPQAPAFLSHSRSIRQGDFCRWGKPPCARQHLLPAFSPVEIKLHSLKKPQEYGSR